jgi:hypothetical protein
MFALCLVIAAGFADPVLVVQLRYPASRITITTASQHQVYYTLSRDAPIELRRAYKLLEVAEREVLITEALQLFRAEMVANERKLEALKTARHASYLDQSSSPFRTLTQEASSYRDRTGRLFSSQTLIHVDPTLTMLVPESTLKKAVGVGLAYDAQVERAVAAINRMAEAQYQLRLTLVDLAYPDTSDRPVVQKPGKIEVTRDRPDPVPNPPQAARPAPVTPAARTALDEAVRLERVAAAAEVLAADRAQQAQATERAAAAAYRAAAPDDQARTRAAWVSARDEWELARLDWADARENLLSARHQLQAARLESTRTSVSPPAPPAPPVEPEFEPGGAGNVGGGIEDPGFYPP